MILRVLYWKIFKTYEYSRFKYYYYDMLTTFGYAHNKVIEEKKKWRYFLTLMKETRKK